MNIVDTFPKFSFCVEVSADFAEFTNKKDERISYPVPTSGALRGFLQSIFWKPAIKYVVRKVEVLNPVRYMNVKKNELKTGFNSDLSPVVASDDRIQRNNVYLRDVRYRVHADLVFVPLEYRTQFIPTYEAREEKGDTPVKYLIMLKRRVEQGQFKYSPYLGTRECCVDDVAWIDENSPKSEPIKESANLGMMYVDFAYNEDYTVEQREVMNGFISKETGKKQKKDAKVQPRPLSANVVMTDGVVEYPSKYDLLDTVFGKMAEFWKKNS